MNTLTDDWLRAYLRRFIRENPGNTQGRDEALKLLAKLDPTDPAHNARILQRRANEAAKRTEKAG